MEPKDNLGRKSKKSIIMIPNINKQIVSKITSDTDLNKNISNKFVQDTLSNIKKYENKEATASGGAGQFSAPLFGDMKEEETNNTVDLDFYKKTKDYDKKTITAAYKIIDDTKDKVIEVLNIQESEYKNLMFVSGHIAYTIKIYKFRLPKSQIKILDDDTKHEGFKFIEIPFWLVNKSREQYEIKRLKDKKRLANIYNKPVDDIRGQVDDEVVEYLKVTDGDYETLRKINVQTGNDNDIKKVETKEATGSGSSGSYVTPAAWAKSGSKKNWRGARKTQIPGGKFVEVRKKCQKFPYCNQGDIKALKIFENDKIKEVIKNISKKHNINEDVIKNILRYELDVFRKYKK
jgi:hypothetical protein